MRILSTIGAAGGLLLAACVGEVGVRQFPDLMPVEKQFMESAVHSPFQALVADPDVGFLAPPGLHKPVRTRDLETVWETDREGFPNSDPWPEHPGMVFLGDSLVVGFEVGVSRSFPRLIADQLQSTEVNLALIGAGPERQFAVYRKFGTGLQPRHVVTCVYLSSDVSNDQHFAAWIREGKPGDYNRFRLTMARNADEARVSTLGSNAKKSWLYVLGRELVLSWLPGYIPDRHRFADGSEILLNRTGIKAAMTETSPDDPRIPQLLASFEKLRSVAAQGGSTLSVVLVPSKDELFGVPAGATNATLRSRILPRLDAAGFSVLDLYPAVQQAGLQRSPYYRVDGHFNEYGHRVVADTFVTWFRRAFPDTRRTSSSDAR